MEINLSPEINLLHQLIASMNCMVLLRANGSGIIAVTKSVKQSFHTPEMQYLYRKLKTNQPNVKGLFEENNYQNMHVYFFLNLNESDT